MAVFHRGHESRLTAQIHFVGHAKWQRSVVAFSAVACGASAAQPTQIVKEIAVANARVGRQGVVAEMEVFADQAPDLVVPVEADH